MKKKNMMASSWILITTSLVILLQLLLFFFTDFSIQEETIHRHHHYIDRNLLSEQCSNQSSIDRNNYDNHMNNDNNESISQFILSSLSIENLEFNDDIQFVNKRSIKSNNQYWLNSESYKIYSQQLAVYQNANLFIDFYINSDEQVVSNGLVCGRTMDLPCPTIQKALDSLDYILQQNYSSFLANTAVNRAVTIRFVLMSDIFECYSSIITPPKQNLKYIIMFQSMDNSIAFSALYCFERDGFPIIGKLQRQDLQLIVFNGLSLHMYINGCRAYNYIFFDVSFESIRMAVNLKQNCAGTEVKGDFIVFESCEYNKAKLVNSGFIVYGYTAIYWITSVVYGDESAILFSDISSVRIFQCKFEDSQLFIASSSELLVYRCLLINSKIASTNIATIKYDTNEFIQFKGDPVIMADFGTSIQILNAQASNGESFASIQGFSSVIIDKVLLKNNSNTYSPQLKNLVLIEQSYEVTISNSQFLNNRGMNGSLFINKVFKLIISKSSFIGNVAQYSGGAIFIPIFSRSYINAAGVITECVFENNTSLEGSGGAVFIDFAFTISFLSCTFKGNSAYLSGGAIYIGTVTLQFQYSGSIFDSNRVFGEDTISNAGGAIFLILATKMDDYIWKSATFINNYAKKGGAIAYMPHRLIENGRFIKTKFINNQALLLGAAVFIFAPEIIDPDNEFIGNQIIGNQIIGTNIPNNVSYAMSELQISNHSKSNNFLTPGSEHTFYVEARDNIGNLIPLYYEKLGVYTLNSNVLFKITNIGNYTITVMPYLLTNESFYDNTISNVYETLLNEQPIGEKSSLVEVSLYFKADLLVQKFYHTVYFTNCDKGFHIEKVPGNIKGLADGVYLYACVKDPQDYTWLIITIVVPVTIIAFTMGLIISLLVYFVLRKLVNSLRRLREKDKAEEELERKLNDKKVIFDLSDEEAPEYNSKPSKKSTSTNTSVGGDLFIPLLDSIENQSFIIPIEDLNIEKKIGEGGNGVVYLGKWRNIKVAIKSIKSLDMSNEVDEFDKEAAILSRLHHLNIVQFYGVALTKQNKYMITEFLTKGSLDQVIYQCKNGTLRLQFSMRISILLDVANGMDYLHNMKPTIIHRDLKPGNILLNDHFQGKVCDFGLVRLVRNTIQSTMTMNIGTLMYLAPEAVDNSIIPKEEKKSVRIATKLDVYSFAVIMYELLFCIVPFIENPLTKEVQKDVTPYRIPYLVSRGSRPITLESREEIAEWISNQNSYNFNIRKTNEENDAIISLLERYQKLMMKCWNQQPLERPSFGEIISELSELAELF